MIITDFDNTLVNTLQAAKDHSDVFISKFNPWNKEIFKHKNKKIISHDVTTMERLATNKKYKMNKVIRYMIDVLRDRDITIITMRPKLELFIVKELFPEFNIKEIHDGMTIESKVEYIHENNPKYYFEDDSRVLTKINRKVKTKLFVPIHYFNKRDVYSDRRYSIIE